VIIADTDDDADHFRADIDLAFGSLLKAGNHGNAGRPKAIRAFQHSCLRGEARKVGNHSRLAYGYYQSQQLYRQ
jgi:hypothetical protein